MLSTESGFNELVYLEAAQESLTVAQELLSSSRSVMAAYVAGMSVETLLLAYQTRAGALHDAKHDLSRLARNGRFWDGMPPGQKQAIAAELAEIMMRWQNNHRYRSEAAFCDWLVRRKLFVVQGTSTTRRDVGLYNAERLVEAAQRIIGVGVARW